ncbi:MAG: ABC transporter ATP-binding protein [Spirochaetia bacterium]|nr:ABC transporter ATP-binding protein [Spirochaetia bacterium]
MNAIKVKDLNVTYRLDRGERLYAIRGIDLSVEQGESVAIAGESGCGKTTLAHALLNLLARNSEPSGSVVIDGEEVLGRSNRELEKVRGVKAGMIFQDPGASLNPLFTVKEQVEETLKVHLRIMNKDELEDKGLKLLEEAGIADNRRVYGSYPHQLSGGLQQRVMTAIALSCGPKILIADEPTTALDVTVQAQIVSMLIRLKRERGLTLVLITHDLHLACMLCKRIIVMYAGQIVEDGEVNSAEDARHPYTRALFEIIPDISFKKEFKVIPGSVPDLKKVENKCSYCDRCPNAAQKCREEAPGLTDGVRCWYPYEVKR